MQLCSGIVFLCDRSSHIHAGHKLTSSVIDRCREMHGMGVFRGGPQSPKKFLLCLVVTSSIRKEYISIAPKALL